MVLFRKEDDFMINKIKTIINKNHEIISDVSIIGRAGENGCTELEILLDEGLCDSWVYLDFMTQDGSKFKTEKLGIVDDKVVYIIPNSLLQKKGTLAIQLVVQNEEGIVWKSDVKPFYIKESIDAVDEIEYKEDFITEAQKMLDEFEKVVDTIVLDGTGYKFLCDDGEYKEVEGGATGGTRDYEKLENQPSINDVTLTGNKTLDELGIQPKGDYALSSEIPNVSGFITGAEVDKKIDDIEIPEGHTHSNKTILDGITQENIDAWNSNSGGSVDLSNYATKDYVNGLVGAISTNLDVINGEVI